MSEATTGAKTGHDLEHWFAVLDDFDVAKNGHKAAAAHLNDEHGLSPWWAQQLTIQYEQSKGLRQPGQRHNGKFALNVSRTIAVSAARAFEAWRSPSSWDQWLSKGSRFSFAEGERFETANGEAGKFERIVVPGPKRSMNEVARIVMTWESAKVGPGSVVTVQFLEKGPEKTAVALTHDRLANQPEGAEMKEHWTRALTSLRSWLESGATGDSRPTDERSVTPA